MKTIIIAGITRSGMTATMQMLNAGGYPCAGMYPGFEPFQLNQIPWDECKGMAVKLIDPQLQFPPNGDYKIILLKRDIKHQAKSMIKFLSSCGFHAKINMKAMKKSIKDDYKKIKSWSKNYDTINLRFEEIIEYPVQSAELIANFVGCEMDFIRMSGVIIDRSSDCSSELFELEMM